MKSFAFSFLWVFLTAPFTFAQTKAASTFNSVITAAVDSIEEVQRKESEVRSAEINRRQSAMQFLPDLNLIGKYAEFGPEPEQRDISRSYGIRSNVNLFRFGGDLRFYKANDYNTASLRNDLQNTRLQMEEVLVLKSLELIASHLETEIRKKIIDAQRSFFAVAEKRYGRGILSRQELDQVTIDLRIAEARLRDAALTEFKNREALKVYFKNLGLRPESQSAASEDLPAVLSTTWPWLKKLSNLTPKKIQFDVKTHPEWQQLQARVSSSEYSAKSKFTNMLPSLDLSLSYENQMAPVTNSVWTDQWMGLVTLTVPLFNRLDNLASYQLAREIELRDRLNLERSSRDLTAQWTTAETEFQTQLESAMTREQTLKISNSLYQDNFRRFQAGRSTANDLFNDQDRLYQAELLVVQGWRSAHESYLRLCHSTGQSLATCEF